MRFNQTLQRMLSLTPRWKGFAGEYSLFIACSVSDCMTRSTRQKSQKREKPDLDDSPPPKSKKAKSGRHERSEGDKVEAAEKERLAIISRGKAELRAIDPDKLMQACTFLLAHWCKTEYHSRMYY